MERGLSIPGMLFSPRSALGVDGNARFPAAHPGQGGSLGQDLDLLPWRRSGRDREPVRLLSLPRRAETRRVAQTSRDALATVRTPRSVLPLRRANHSTPTSRIHAQARRHPPHPARTSERPPDEVHFRQNPAHSMGLFDETPQNALQSQGRAPGHSHARGITFLRRGRHVVAGNTQRFAAGHGQGGTLSHRFSNVGFRHRGRRFRGPRVFPLETRRVASRGVAYETPECRRDCGNVPVSLSPTPLRSTCTHLVRTPTGGGASCLPRATAKTAVRRV